MQEKVSEVKVLHLKISDKLKSCLRYIGGRHGWTERQVMQFFLGIILPIAQEEQRQFIAPSEQDRGGMPYDAKVPLTKTQWSFIVRHAKERTVTEPELVRQLFWAAVEFWERLYPQETIPRAENFKEGIRRELDSRWKKVQ